MNIVIKLDISEFVKLFPPALSRKIIKLIPKIFEDYCSLEYMWNIYYIYLPK